MKIESVRGWVSKTDAPTAGLVCTDVTVPDTWPGQLPVLVVPLTPENIKDKREIVNDLLIEMTDVEDFDYWEAAKTVLTALGLTEEEPC